MLSVLATVGNIKMTFRFSQEMRKVIRMQLYCLCFGALTCCREPERDVEVKFQLLPVDSFVVQGNAAEYEMPVNQLLEDVDGSTGTFFLYVYNLIRKEIDVFDLASGAKVTSIPTQELHRGYRGVLFFNVVSPDSILVRFSADNTFYLVSAAGRILKEWHVHLPNPLKNHRLMDTQQFLLLNDSTVFCAVSFDHNEYLSNPMLQRMYFSGPLGVVLTLRSDSAVVERILGRFPDRYLDRYFDETHAKYAVGNGGLLVFSFRTEDSLFVLDSNGQLSRSYAGHGAFVMPEPLHSNYERDEWREYNCENSFYHKITWDRYRGLYYRQFLYPIDMINPDGTANSPLDRAWSLIILDSNFNVLGEARFEAREYDLRFLHVLPSGVLLSRRGNNPDQMIFVLHDLQSVED